jgi:hypothetical protein
MNSCNFLLTPFGSGEAFFNQLVFNVLRLGVVADF